MLFKQTTYLVSILVFGQKAWSGTVFQVSPWGIKATEEFVTHMSVISEMAVTVIDAYNPHQAKLSQLIEAEGRIHVSVN